MIAVQLAAKESRLAQELVTTMKVVLSVLGLKTDRVATNYVKSVCLNPYWQIVEFFSTNLGYDSDGFVEILFGVIRFSSYPKMHKLW